jgi:hypothetical protein
VYFSENPLRRNLRCRQAYLESMLHRLNSSVTENGGSSAYMFTLPIERIDGVDGFALLQALPDSQGALRRVSPKNLKIGPLEPFLPR